MSPTRKTMALAAIATALLVIAAAWLLRPRDDADPPYRLTPADPQRLAVGERVYRSHCASCHGAKLEGQPNWRERDAQGRLPAPPHDASGHTWHHPDEMLFAITKFGVARAAKLADYPSDMPAYEGVLSDEEIVAVLSWIKSRWPAQIRRRHDEFGKPAE